MGKAWAGIVAVIALAWLAVGAPGDSAGDTRRASAAGERRGLELRVDVVQAKDAIAVETRVVNTRSRPAFLVPDQCGRVTEVVLARKRFEPEGRSWGGSPGAVKRFVVDAQRRAQDPDPLAPRRPGDASQAVPDCRRPERVVKVAPGATVRERWATDPLLDRALDVVGSDHVEIRTEIVEARRPGDMEYLDIAPAGLAETIRAGRRLRLTVPAAEVIDHEPGDPATGPSQAELFDRLLNQGRLRAWMAEQPAASWRDARLRTTATGIELSAVTSRYERAVVARADADGSHVTLSLPGVADRTRAFVTRHATLPRGIRLRRASEDWIPTRDVIAGRLALPSGRIVADGYPSGQSPVIRHRVAAGARPVYVTLARRPGRTARFARVALATLVVSGERPVRWRRIGGIGVDGGVAAFTSREGARALGAVALSDPESEYFERAFDSLTAHDNTVTELPIGGRLNQVLFSTGVGDGGYPLLAGFDHEGRPARFVLDFLILHLRWPGRPG